MPIPDGWGGLFYGPDSMARELVEWTPEQFVECLKIYPDDPVFLVAGAIFDLRRNGLPAKAEHLLQVAKDAFPFPWEKIRTWVETGLKMTGYATDGDTELKRKVGEQTCAHIQEMLESYLASVRQKQASQQTPAP